MLSHVLAEGVLPGALDAANLALVDLFLVQGLHVHGNVSLGVELFAADIARVVPLVVVVLHVHEEGSPRRQDLSANRAHVLPLLAGWFRLPDQLRMRRPMARHLAPKFAFEVAKLTLVDVFHLSLLLPLGPFVLVAGVLLLVAGQLDWPRARVRTFRAVKYL